MGTPPGGSGGEGKTPRRVTVTYFAKKSKRGADAGTAAGRTSRTVTLTLSEVASERAPEIDAPTMPVTIPIETGEELATEPEIRFGDELQQMLKRGIDTESASRRETLEFERRRITPVTTRVRPGAEAKPTVSKGPSPSPSHERTSVAPAPARAEVPALSSKGGTPTGGGSRVVATSTPAESPAAKRAGASSDKVAASASPAASNSAVPKKAAARAPASSPAAPSESRSPRSKTPTDPDATPPKPRQSSTRATPSERPAKASTRTASAPEAVKGMAVGQARSSQIHRALKGMRLFERGDYPAARDILESVVAETPEEPFPYTMLGTVYLALGASDRALALFEAALEMDPNDLAARVYRGELRVFSGKAKAAIVDLEKAVSLGAASDPFVQRAKRLLETAKNVTETETKKAEKRR